MAPQMKGLTQFIMDLRNSKDLEEENKRINAEISNIHAKFASSLSGYQKKKYVSKLIYIHLLGYNDEVDFGLKESLQLIGSSSYSEKHLGYLAVSVFVSCGAQSARSYLRAKLEMTQALLVKDLQSNNEDFNCLAIQFIASNFNVQEALSECMVREKDADLHLWLELIDVVYSFCCLPVANSLVKKKGALALLTLLRLYPGVVLTNDNWIPRLLTLVDDKDLGVVLSAVPLVEFVVDLKTQYVKLVIPAIAGRLFAIVVSADVPQDYYYYDLPAPWLVVKLLKLVEHFFLLQENNEPVLVVSQLDSNTTNNLRQVVARSIQTASQPMKGLPNRNSQSAVLFQAVSLAVFLDASLEAISGAIQALVLLLGSDETNTRYLSLDALVKLTARSTATVTKFDENLPLIYRSLNDKDISVRRKALDLLYTVCNSGNYTAIINKLLDYFPGADFSLRSEVAVKVAVLSERFATDSTWYVTIMLRLLSIGGSGTSGSSAGSPAGSSGTASSNYIGSEVWERIVQIIVNNESLQKRSCKLIINLLKKPAPAPNKGKAAPAAGTPENLIKVAAFVLGEFGNVLDDTADSATPVQFQFLYEAYFKVSLPTRAMLLSTFVKLIMRAPDGDYVPDILDLLEAETQSIDLEIQTRSFEYLKIATVILSNSVAGSNLEKTLMKPLPAFQSKENSLMNRLGSVHSVYKTRNRSSSFVNALKINKTPNSLNVASTGNLRSTASLLLQEEAEPGDEDPFGDNTTKPHARLTPHWYSGYHRMLHYDAGIFFEDQLIKITYRTVKNGPSISIKFTIINNAAKTASTDITGLTLLDVESLTSSEDPNYVISVVQLPELTVSDKTSMELEIKIRNVVENNESPILSMSFKCSGSFNTLNLKFPVLLLKTLTPTTPALEEFKKRWLQIGELLGAEQGEFRATADVNHRHMSSNIVRLLSRIGFSVVHSTSDDESVLQNGGILVMGAGILHTSKAKYGVLSTVRSTDGVGKRFEVVVRCTGGGVPEVIALSLKEILQG